MTDSNAINPLPSAQVLVEKGLQYIKNKEYAQAYKCFLVAAGQGDAEAQYRLATCFYMGRGTAQNYESAASLYLRAAEQGYAPAQNIIGILYTKGKEIGRASCRERVF